MKPILYHHPASSASWRVRIALALKDVDYDRVVVDPRSRETEAESYSALNPLSQVPSFAIDGSVLAQSMAILEYLDERFPNPPLLPDSATDRAQVRQLCEAVNAGTQPLHNVALLRELTDQFGFDEARLRTWVHFWGHKRLTALEAMLESVAGTYSFGDSVTLADLLLVPQVEKLREAGVGMGDYPTASRVVGELLALPAFRDTGFQCDPGASFDAPSDPG